MKRMTAIALSTLLFLPAARGQTPEEKKATIAYLRNLQTKQGGFRAAKPNPGGNGDRAEDRPGLRATNAALRALKYFGGEAPDYRAAARFLRSCFHQSSGGFSNSDSPSARPDVVTTAVGLMGVVELKMPAEKFTAKAVQYLENNAKSFEEIRMAAAGLEGVKRRPAKARDWLREVRKLRHSDGTYGKGGGVARETGSAVVTVLRLGGKVEHPGAVVKALRKGQRKDGGFGKEGQTGSDLETTYRVMRAFVMLKARPADVAAVRHFVARCRNRDGGYGVAPGKGSTVSGTYFASIVLKWSGEMRDRSGRQ
jgi:prenyltransferase beta subunit